MEYNKIKKIKFWIVLSLIMGACYTSYFIYEYKDSLDIGSPDNRDDQLLRIHRSDDPEYLKRRAESGIRFLYDYQGTVVQIWGFSVVYGAANILILSYCTVLLKRVGSKDL